MSQFTLKYADGQQFTVDENQLWGMLLGLGELQEVTIAVKEKIDRVKFHSIEKFISGKRSFDRAWAIVRSVQDPQMQVAARRLANLAIQKDIMETEAWFSQMIQVMIAKEGCTPSWRNPENPFVKAGWDIQAAFQTSGLNVEGAQSA